jgi:hypothetical protein
VQRFQEGFAMTLIIVVVVGASMVGVAVILWQLRGRVDPIVRHARAISALRDIAQTGRSTPELTRSEEPVTGLRVLQEAPTPPGPQRRRSDPGTLRRKASTHTRRPTVTPEPQGNLKAADRPTIATLPTIGWRPINGHAPTTGIDGPTIDNESRPTDTVHDEDTAPTSS